MVRLGLAGGGLAAQAAHLPALGRLGDRFTVAALADPSRTVRDRVSARFGIPETYADWRAMLGDARLDALVVCTPNATHAEIALAALDDGLHVLVEKPLCLTVEDADRLVAAQVRAGRVLQVGYMKRFEPAFALMAQAVASGEPVRLVQTTTYDPVLAREPFVAGLVGGGDVPPAVVDAAHSALADQLETAFGSRDVDRLAPFSDLYLGALIHDVNLVHGLVGAGAEPLHSAIWMDGRAATGTWRLPGGGHWHASFAFLPGVGRFRERIELLADDAVHRLEFDAPYLQEIGARYARIAAAERVVHDGAQGAHRGSYTRQLAHFHAAIEGREACLTPATMAREDIVALTDLYKLALAA
jgi:predicted dehydrogenase